MATLAYTQPPCVYPSVIARAVSVIDELPVFRTAPDGYLRVLVRIVKKINISHPTCPIRASRRTIATESGKSVETVGRCVKWLEDHGLIQRDQKARSGLRGSSSPLVPTKTLLDALLITKTSVDRVASPALVPPLELPLVVQKDMTSMDSYPQASPVSADRSKSVSQPLSNLSENNRQVSVSVKSPNDSATSRGYFVKLQGFAIPQELAWLVTSNGMQATGVLALMRAARKTQQRLSDVVAATRRYLEPLEGRELFAYLTALVSKDKDYGYLAREDAKSHQQQQARDRLTRKAIELVGRRYKSRDGKVFVLVEKGGILTEIRDGLRAARPMGAEFLHAIEDGRLTAIRE